LRARLAVLIGGRVAEEIALEDITTGAENDLVEATRLARRMVTRWGMGDLGLAAFKIDDEHPFLGYELSQGRDYSEATADRIDREVNQILEESQATARRLLVERRNELDDLVDALMSTETLDEEMLSSVLGPRPNLVAVI
jgi:cell division protease FtsH